MLQTSTKRRVGSISNTRPNIGSFYTTSKHKLSLPKKQLKTITKHNYQPNIFIEDQQNHPNRKMHLQKHQNDLVLQKSRSEIGCIYASFSKQKHTPTVKQSNSSLQQSRSRQSIQNTINQKLKVKSNHFINSTNAQQQLRISQNNIISTFFEDKHHNHRNDKFQEINYQQIQQKISHLFDQTIENQIKFKHSSNKKAQNQIYQKCFEDRKRFNQEKFVDEIFSKVDLKERSVNEMHNTLPNNKQIKKQVNTKNKTNLEEQVLKNIKDKKYIKNKENIFGGLQKQALIQTQKYHYSTTNAIKINAGRGLDNLCADKLDLDKKLKKIIKNYEQKNHELSQQLKQYDFQQKNQEKQQKSQNKQFSNKDNEKTNEKTNENDLQILKQCFKEDKHLIKNKIILESFVSSERYEDIFQKILLFSHKQFEALNLSSTHTFTLPKNANETNKETQEKKSEQFCRNILDVIKLQNELKVVKFFVNDQNKQKILCLINESRINKLCEEVFEIENEQYDPFLVEQYNKALNESKIEEITQENHQACKWLASKFKKYYQDIYQYWMKHFTEEIISRFVRDYLLSKEIEGIRSKSYFHDQHSTNTSEFNTIHPDHLKNMSIQFSILLKINLKPRHLYRVYHKLVKMSSFQRLMQLIQILIQNITSKKNKDAIKFRSASMPKINMEK